MEYMTKLELKRLLQVAYDSNRHHHLALVVSHATRVSELLAIKSADIHDGQLTIRRLKGSITTNQPIRLDPDPLFDCSPLIDARTSRRHRPTLAYFRSAGNAAISSFAFTATAPTSIRANATCTLSDTLWPLCSGTTLPAISAYSNVISGTSQPVQASSICMSQTRARRQLQSLKSG